MQEVAVFDRFGGQGVGDGGVLLSDSAFSAFAGASQSARSVSAGQQLCAVHEPDLGNIAVGVAQAYEHHGLLAL